MDILDQIERIKMMEQHFNRISHAIIKLSAALEDYAEAQKAISELQAYYCSDDWKQDFADDEAGRLPQDLRRGVLSEDGIWNVLSDSQALNIRMLELVTEITSGETGASN